MMTLIAMAMALYGITFYGASIVTTTVRFPFNGDHNAFDGNGNNLK